MNRDTRFSVFKNQLSTRTDRTPGIMGCECTLQTPPKSRHLQLCSVTALPCAKNNHFNTNSCRFFLQCARSIWVGRLISHIQLRYYSIKRLRSNPDHIHILLPPSRQSWCLWREQWFQSGNGGTRTMYGGGTSWGGGWIEQKWGATSVRPTVSFTGRNYGRKA